jgi:branched-chain amino acid transport system ATP-binding protein
VTGPGRRTPGVRWGVVLAATAAAFLLPYAGHVPLIGPQIVTEGIDWTSALFNMSYYALLALGLNVVVGYAGLLDLGYVGFFAVGAYGRIQALHGISLTVGEGEIVALIGANGAGKSTTMRAISGLRPVAQGKIRFDGADITKMRADLRVVRGVSQSPEGRGIFPGMTVRDNLEMGAYTRRNRSEIDQDMQRVFDLFPRLQEREKQAGGTLSGGEQQMLAVGRALMSRPKLLLLDEPSMGLAPMLIQQIFDIIVEINQQGTTVLLVEQNAQQALSRAHRAYVLETGRIVKEGTGNDLLTDPAVKDAYLGVA